MGAGRLGCLQLILWNQRRLRDVKLRDVRRIDGLLGRIRLLCLSRRLGCTRLLCLSRLLGLSKLLSLSRLLRRSRLFRRSRRLDVVWMGPSGVGETEDGRGPSCIAL